MWLLLGCPVVTQADRDSIQDRDGDGFAAIGFGGLDCNDDDPDVHPLAEEDWDNDIDENCDGNRYDQDEDGLLPLDEGGTDCDDTDPEIDDTLFLRLVDVDEDGYGNDLEATQEVCPNLPGYADVGGDCDDDRAFIYPGAYDEPYDGFDADCAGDDDYDVDQDGIPVDEDCDDNVPGDEPVLLAPDADGDGFGDDNDVAERCPDTPGFTDVLGDCDDGDASVNPDAEDDPFYDGVDQDCDGSDDFDQDGDGLASFEHGGTDCDDLDPTVFDLIPTWLDADGDGYGAQTPYPTYVACTVPLGFVENGDDCDDENSGINPAAAEVCDSLGIDENCNGSIDDEDLDAIGKLTWYVDGDSDGYGDDANVDAIQFLCDAPAGYVSEPGDCNDEDEDAFPGQTWYRDRDGDLFGAGTPFPLPSCERPFLYVANNDDCNDNDVEINPLAVDEPFDLVDRDCDRGSEADLNDDGYPDPPGDWPAEYEGPTGNEPLEAFDVSCPGLRHQLHVGAGQPYATPEQALDDAISCDTLVLHEGVHPAFVVPANKEGIVITGATGERAIVQGSVSGIHSLGRGLVVANLEIETTGTAITGEQGAYVEWVDIVGASTAIEVDGTLQGFGWYVRGGSRAVTQGGGAVRIGTATFDGVLGGIGASVLDIDGSLVVLDTVTVMWSTPGAGAPLINASASIVRATDLTFSHNVGKLTTVSADTVVASRLRINDNQVPDARGFEVVANTATVLDTVVTGNSWQGGPLAGSGFLAVESDGTVLIEGVTMVGNYLTDFASSPWIRTEGASATKTVGHALVVSEPFAPILGAGIAIDLGVVRQATLVGLDVGVSAIDGLATVQDSILWDNRTNLANGAVVALLDPQVKWNCGPPGELDPLCTSADPYPEFLRYHPSLPVLDWDLRLHRSSPYYDVDEGSFEPTCEADNAPAIAPGIDVSEGAAVEGQLGAYGARGTSAVALTPFFNRILNAAYNDCNGNGLYDSWEATFGARLPLDDLDGDGLDNLTEFDQGTMPNTSDTDGDGAPDGPGPNPPAPFDLSPLDPTVQ